MFKLYDLYGFDPVNDMTVDRMHMNFNMLKRELSSHIMTDMKENSSKSINDRDPDVGGLIHKEDFERGLNAVCWTVEQRESGIPTYSSFKDTLGSWKTDQYVKCVSYSSYHFENHVKHCGLGVS